MATPNSPLWEVFIRSRNGLAHKHVGSLHAADATLALQAARDIYTRRGEGLSIWVVPSSAITASDPSEKGMMFEPAGIQDLPASNVLRRAGRSRTYVMTAASITVSETPLVLYVLRRADDALVLGHRLSEWCGHAPMMEEDMAMANMGLDLLGQARELYGYAAKVEGKDNNEDKLAYLRDVRQYRNLLLLEQPNGDFARTMTRQFFYASFSDLYWRAMMASRDTTLAAIAAKSEKESAYHLRHSSEWMVRLGDGTEESHRRAQAAVDDLWAFTGEMFAVDDSERGLIDAGIAIDPESLRTQWLATVARVIDEATLKLPANDWMQRVAGSATIPNISVICSASCNRCSERFRERRGEPHRTR